jgi:hypothetical protein
VDAQIGDARADTGTVVDLHRAFAAHGLCAAIDSMPPSGAGALDGQAKMNIAGACGRLRVGALSRRLTIEQFEDDAPGRSTNVASTETPGTPTIFPR